MSRFGHMLVVFANNVKFVGCWFLFRGHISRDSSLTVNNNQPIIMFLFQFQNYLLER